MIPVVLDNTIFSLQKAGGVSGIWALLIEHLMRIEGLQLRFLERPDATSNIFRRRMHLPPDSIIPDTRKPLHLARYLPAKVKASGPFIFHTPYYRICNNPAAINVVTLHDFTYELQADHGRLATYVHSHQKTKALRKARAIVPVSVTTLKDMRKLVPERLTSIQKVIPNPPLSLPAPGEHPAVVPEHYLLFVGARAGYKNFAAVVKALADTPLLLKVAGAPLTVSERQLAAKLIQENRLEEIVYPSSKELSSLYHHAWCLIYPSSYEGFGIPIIEAQAHGCPVITSNASACVETGGDGIISLSELDSRSICSAVMSLSDSNLRTDLIESGLRNSARFSGQRTAEAYLELYRHLSEQFSDNFSKFAT